MRPHAAPYNDIDPHPQSDEKQPRPKPLGREPHRFDSRMIAPVPRKAPAPTVMTVAGRPSSISVGPSQLGGSVSAVWVAGMVTLRGGARQAAEYAVGKGSCM